MSKPDWKRVAQQLNDHLASQRLSSQDVANRAGIDRKTVDRLRAGRAVRAQTLQWIEQALKVALGDTPTTVDKTAPADFGGYRRDSVAAYIGKYIAYRRSYDTLGRIIASDLEIVFDDALGALRFNESRDDRLASGKAYTYRFNGDVLIPPNLGIMNLIVRAGDGRVRLISTSMPREDAGTLYMKGFILTLNELRDIGYYPVTSPVFLARLGGPLRLEAGVLQSGEARYAWAAEILDDIENKFSPHA